MKLKLVYPLWTHLTAVLLILIAIFFTPRAFPLPDTAPIHFDINGQPNGYWSPLASSLLLFGISLGFLVLSAWLDRIVSIDILFANVIDSATARMTGQ